MKQRIVVSGAERSLGKSVCTALAASDWATPVAVLGADEAALRTVLDGAHAVAHCVGGEPSGIVRSARALYGALARRANSPRVVHLSSITVYGSATGTVDESSPPRADLGNYSRAQWEAEGCTREYPNAVILRPGAEYGPYCPDWSDRVARWLQTRRLGDLGSRGDGTANLVFIGDLTAVVLEALQRPGIAGEVFNVVQPEKPTWNDYFTEFAEALGAVPVRRITRRQLVFETKIFAPPLKIAENLSEAAGLRLRLPQPIPPSLLRLCAQEMQVNGSKATTAFAVQWTLLHQGLVRTAATYRR